MKKPKIPKLSKADNKKQHERDLHDIREYVQLWIAYWTNTDWQSEKKEIYLESGNRLLKQVEKFIRIRKKPIPEISTVSGLTFKLDDAFMLRGNKTKYKAVLFPDPLTIRGEIIKSKEGIPSVIEIYIEDAVKPKKKKYESKKKKPVKKDRKK